MTQTFVTIPQEEWTRIVNILHNVEERLKPQNEWLDTKNACAMLGVSLSTWATYRKKFKVNTSQVGRKVLVRKSEVELLINSRRMYE